MLRSIFILFLFPILLLGKEFKAGGPALDREEVTCHLPEREHLANGVGTDGFGLCVFTSLELAAKWSNEPALLGFRDFMTKHPGGGWPEKVDQFIPKMAASKGLPTPNWVQHVGGDAEFLRHALNNGRYVCVTYDGRDGVFYRQRIAHMVNLVHFSDRYAVIQDNNYPGQWLWMSPADFLERWRGHGGGWAIALGKAGPPPIPMNIVGAVTEPPATMPKAKPLAVVHEEDEPNYGVSLHGLSPTAMYRVNGQNTPRAEALAALGKVPNDGKQPRLTIIGNTAFRQRVRHDLASHPLLQPWRDRLIVQDYPPDHWAVADVGFAEGISFQPAPNADGKAPIIWRLTAYSGPEGLAGALRKADPLYKPERDPDPSKAEPSNAEPEKVPLAGVPAWSVWGSLGLALGWFLRRLKWPSGDPPRLPDVRTLVLESLYDLLRGPNPVPVRVPTNEDLRQKLQQLLTSSENPPRSGPA